MWAPPVTDTRNRTLHKNAKNTQRSVLETTASNQVTLSLSNYRSSLPGHLLAFKGITAISTSHVIDVGTFKKEDDIEAQKIKLYASPPRRPRWQQFFVDLVTSDDETSSPLSLYDSIEMSRKNKRKKSKKGKGKGKDENEEKEVKLLVTYDCDLVGIRDILEYTQRILGYSEAKIIFDSKDITQKKRKI